MLSRRQQPAISEHDGTLLGDMRWKAHDCLDLEIKYEVYIIAYCDQPWEVDCKSMWSCNLIGPVRPILGFLRTCLPRPKLLMFNNSYTFVVFVVQMFLDC